MPRRKNVKANTKQPKKKDKSNVFAEARTYSGTTKRSPKAKKDNSFALSRCAFKYALAIADPFNPEARGACIPIAPSPPSLKSTSVGRLTVTIGTQGVGWLIFSPCLNNNQPCIWYTSASYALNTISPLSANNVYNTGVLASNMANTFARANLAPVNGSTPVSGRIVSMGVRMRYIGTTLNESGSYYCYTTPDHSNVLGSISTPSDIGNFVEATVMNVTREPCELSVFPIDTEETVYSQQTNTSATLFQYPYGGTNAAFNGGFTLTDSSILVGSPISVIAVTGVAGSQFLTEFVQHNEYTGPSAYPLATFTDADTRGYEIVSAAAMQLPTKRSQTSYLGKPTIQLLMDGIKEVGNALKPVAINTLIKLGTAALTI